MHLPDLEEKGFYMRVRAMEREREAVIWLS